MAKEARAKYKEKSITEITEGIESLRLPIDCEKLLGIDNLHTSFSSELEKELRDIPAKDTRHVRENAEFVDRITDLEGTNKVQKIASIRWFGEQDKQEHIVVLEELEKEEDDAEIKPAIKKALLRLTERINDNRSINEDDIFLDDSDVYVSPVRSSIRVKMKARMKGRGVPLPVDENDVLLDDSDVYVSPVRSSIRVKMKARMKG